MAKLGRIGIALVVLATLVAAIRLLDRDRARSGIAEPAPTGTSAASGESVLSDSADGRVVTPYEATVPQSSSDAPGAPTAPRLAIEVLDEDGRGVPDARVQLVFEDARQVECGAGARADTDENGRCQVDPRGIDSGSGGPWWRVEAFTPGRRLVVVPQRIPEGAAKVKLSALRMGRLEGHVSRRDDAPLGHGSKLVVRWRVGDAPEGESWGLFRDGEYSLGDVVGRVTSIELERHSLANLRLVPVPNIEVPAGGTVRADFVFDVHAALLLTCLDAADGRPISDVRLEEPFYPLGASDRRGSLRVPDVLEPGKETSLELAHDDYSPRSLRVLAPIGATEWPVTVELERSPVIAGLVTDARSAPKAGLDVICEQCPEVATGSRLPSFSVRGATDEQGRFRLSGLPSRGKVQISFCVELDPLWAETIDVSEASAPERWVIPDPVAIRGHVVDASGSPVEGLALNASGPAGWLHGAATTGPEGVFEIPNAVPGRWTLWTEHGSTIEHGVAKSSQRSSMEVDVGLGGASGVELRLRPPRTSWGVARLRLQIVDASTREHLEVTWLALSGRDVCFELCFRPRRPGIHELRVPDGTYDFAVIRDGYVPARQVLELGAGEHEHVIEMRRH
jgi:hypothetical protein